MGTWSGNAVMLALGLVIAWSGWIILRWRRDPARHGDRLARAVQWQLQRRSPRGLARTFVPQAWWTTVLGTGFALAAAWFTLVRLSLLPLDLAVVAAYLVVVPLLGGFVGLGVVRLTGPPASMRLVPREPTSERDLMHQLARLAAGDDLDAPG